MHIIFCCDRRVLPGLHVAAYSLVDRFDTTHTYPQITLFSDALTEADVTLLRQTLDSLNKPFSLTLHTIDISQFQNFPTLNNSWATYYRLYAFQSIEADRALYVDADTLCDIDVSALEGLAMGEAPVAWVPEAPLSQAVDQEVAEQLGAGASEFYFNAGVMLINVPKWHRQDISSKAMDYIATHQPKFHDQSALNVILHQKALALDKEFNCMSNVRKNWPYIRYPYGKIGRLIHFLDYPKPWDFLAEWTHPQYALWNSVLKKTSLKKLDHHFLEVSKGRNKNTLIWSKYNKALKDKFLFFCYKNGVPVKGL